MSRLIELNREFYDLMGFPYPNKPTSMDINRRMIFMAYIMGELTEFGNSSDIVDQIDAMTDILYFVMDMFLEIGIAPEKVYEIVHETNMNKVWSDGLPRINLTVVPPRVVKPPGWIPPTIGIETYVHYISTGEKDVD